MNQSYTILPIYSGDVSGVASALYELGGMVVMHDPSGCNSTYNTHDETRWYQDDSLIYISGLTEMDAILGNEDKFLSAVEDAARRLHPRFIALASAPIPFLNGTDFPALARLLQQRLNLPVFFVPTNGMHDYMCGAGAALREIARRFVTSCPAKLPHSINILGATPLDFAAKGSMESLRNVLTDEGLHIISCWAMGDTLDTLSNAGQAAVNLVISAVGLPAAKELQKKCGTPFVVGLPVNGFAETVLKQIRQAENDGQNRFPCLQRSDFGQTVRLVGEPVAMGSLGAALAQKYAIKPQILCPLEQCGDLITDGDVLTTGEEEIEPLLQGNAPVIADPLYRPVCSPDAPFYALPHEAFSGRCFRKSMKNLLTLPLTKGEPSHEPQSDTLRG